jgi:hypothetical protein
MPFLKKSFKKSCHTWTRASGKPTLDVGGDKMISRLSLIRLTPPPLLNINRCRRHGDSGRIRIGRRVANGRITIGGWISGRPVGVVAEPVAQQPHSQCQAVTAAVTVMSMMMSMVAMSSSSPCLGRRDRPEQHERHTHQSDCSHYCLHSKIWLRFPAEKGRGPLHTVHRGHADITHQQNFGCLVLTKISQKIDNFYCAGFPV